MRNGARGAGRAGGKMERQEREMLRLHGNCRESGGSGAGDVRLTRSARMCPSWPCEPKAHTALEKHPTRTECCPPYWGRLKERIVKKSGYCEASVRENFRIGFSTYFSRCVTVISSCYTYTSKQWQPSISSCHFFYNLKSRFSVSRCRGRALGS